MSARPEPRASNLTSRHHPAVPVAARQDDPQPATDRSVRRPQTLSSNQQEKDITLTQVNVKIDATVVRRAKARLAMEGLTMQQLVGDFLRDWVEQK